MSKPQLLSNDTDTFVYVRDGRIVDRNVGISTSSQRRRHVNVGIRQLPIDNDVIIENKWNIKC